MMKPLSVFAIILNYNTAAETIALFENLKDYYRDFLNILVIDNHSIEEDQVLLKKSIPVKNLIFNRKNLGYAAGNNIGISQALEQNANFVWILNPDIRVEEGTLHSLLKLILSDEKIAVVGPRIRSRIVKNQIFSDGGVVIFDERCHTDLINYDKEVSRTPSSINFNVDYVDGSCALLNMETVKEIGLLPEDYFLYFEETDWCTRAKRSGWSLAINSYVNAYNLKSPRNSNYIYYTFRNRLIYARKYHPSYKKVYWFYTKNAIIKVWNRLRYGMKYPLLEWELKGIVDAFKYFI